MRRAARGAPSALGGGSWLLCRLSASCPCFPPRPGVSERPRVSPHPSTFPDCGTHGPQPQISQAAPAPLRCPSSVTLLPIQPHGCLHYPSRLFCIFCRSVGSRRPGVSPASPPVEPTHRGECARTGGPQIECTAHPSSFARLSCAHLLSCPRLSARWAPSTPHLTPSAPWPTSWVCALLVTHFCLSHSSGSLQIKSFWYLGPRDAVGLSAWDREGRHVCLSVCVRACKCALKGMLWRRDREGREERQRQRERERQTEDDRERQGERQTAVPPVVHVMLALRVRF